MSASFKKAWVVDTSMGYGHQRAAFALRSIAQGQRVVHADQYQGIPHSDKAVWETSRRLYETMSRFKKIPVLGDIVFGIFDKFQEIQEFYPKMQAIEHPTLQLRQVYGLMEKKQWGKHLIERLNENPLPLVATFPAIAFMAEYWGYEGPVWLVVTDTDISRAWAPLKAAQSEIGYFVPTSVARERLLRYGVPGRNIFHTGFPLPPDLLRHAKEDLRRRIQALDPAGEYQKSYADLVKHYLGAVPAKRKQVPVVTFAVGGAGVQEDIAQEVLEGLSPLLRRRKIRLNLVAGMHKGVTKHFHELAAKHRLSSSVNIVYRNTGHEYFWEFARVLRKTDILWTKPSELVFYAALGIPLLLAPPVGSQEDHNQEYIVSLGAGIKQLDPKLAAEWVQDMINKGSFAEAAMQGFVEMEKRGTENISKIICAS
ncbi:MAG: hypothetical protein HYS60_01695 [Candidatus Wildermuthbacteria bacterium]|nr:hypothetical protein [Candidatus Wildermuthbacteria bacterium]